MGNDWRAFFKLYGPAMVRGFTIEELYQAFKERLANDVSEIMDSRTCVHGQPRYLQCDQCAQDFKNSL